MKSVLRCDWSVYFQISPAVRDMVRAVYPEALALRQSDKLKIAATKDLHALVFSDSKALDPVLLQVRFCCALSECSDNMPNTRLVTL